MEENNITVDKAVQTIKGAILRAQAQASQSSNAIQLSLYYGIGPLCVYQFTASTLGRKSS